MKKVLVVFYSRSGHTRRAGERLARVLDADLDVIAEARHRGGRFGFVRSVFDALLARQPSIETPQRDPRRYRVVVVGTPVWAAHVASPVRTYLLRYAAGLPRLAFFCTLGGSGGDETLAEMAALADTGEVETVERGRFPTLALSEREIDAGDFIRLDAFAKAVQAAG